MEPLVRKAGLLDDESGLHLLTLSVLLLNKFGPEFIAWTSECLREELEDHYGNIGPVTWERIQALRVLHANESFWKEWEIFEKITAAIMGEPPIFSYVQPPEAEEIAIALETAKRIDKHEYSDEVKKYIAASCLNDGLWYLEDPPLDIAKEALREYDIRLGIERRAETVAAALQAKEGFYDSPETAPEVQANRVREVALVLKRYNAAVESQLKNIGKAG